MRKAGILLVLLLAPAAWADTSEDWTAIAQRLRTRQQVLQAQENDAARRVREQALVAYRLRRRRDLGFFTVPELRTHDAQASDLAIASLQLRHVEKRTLSSELERVEAELRELERARLAQQETTASDNFTPRFTRPVKGAVVGEPGLRHETPTSTEIRRDGLEFLARLNEPVRAVGGGIVQVVPTLPQGGYAVVTQHPAGWVSIVSGLRDVSVRPGEPVAQGQSIGLAGRNLDGAAVISVELWHNRKPIEPRGRFSSLKPWPAGPDGAAPPN